LALRQPLLGLFCVTFFFDFFGDIHLLSNTISEVTL